MNGYLLDTNVASETRKGRRINPGVRAWIGSVPDHELFLSVLVLGEIRKGIELAKTADPAKAGALGIWLHETETIFADRVLPVTASVDRKSVV